MSYHPSGWIQWPAHPQQSIQFQRVLGLAREGAATAYYRASEMFQGAG